MTRSEIAALKEKLEPFKIRESRPQWTLWQIRTADQTVTAYESGKVVFSNGEKTGNKTKKRTVSIFPQAGSDEVGTGDYFGPVVCAACIVEEKNLPLLEKWGITDSKAMDDEIIRKAYPELLALPHSILVVDNDRYNRVHEKVNLNKMKAVLHNQCYRNLEKKGYVLPDLCMVDQFTPKASFYKYVGDEAVPGLSFETKAESRYPAVAAASVLARGRFLAEMDRLKDKWGMGFQLGAGAPADQCGWKFVNMHGKENLSHVAKVHFKNTEKILG